MLYNKSVQKEETKMNTDKIYAEQIANEYAPKDTSKVKALKRLDNKAKMPSNIFTYTFGIISALVLGVGMCMCMGICGSTAALMAVGIILGLIGIVGMSLNYTIYRKILNQSKAKYAQDIINLANEISNEENKND